MEAGGTPGRRGNPLWWGHPPVHMISHFNLITSTLPDRVTLSAGVKFCHVNVQGGVTRLAGVGFVILQIRAKFTLVMALHHY